MSEIFELSIDDELSRLNNIMESDSETDEIEEPEPEIDEPEPEPEPEPAPVPKKKGGRKPLTPERKAQLKEQLARGRATSLAKRRNNGKLKKLNKAKALVADEIDIVLSTKSPAELRAELKALKKQMKTQSEKPSINIADAPVSRPKPLKELPTTPKVESPPIVLKVEPVNTGPPAWLMKRTRNKYL
tara:strand:- start:1519 stop:2079 length:561 start_codon:yes stop_codon:yes gene_type:complete